MIFLILGICGITWLVQGKHSYTGPKDIDGLLALARHGLQKGEVLTSHQLVAMRSRDAPFAEKEKNDTVAHAVQA